MAQGFACHAGAASVGDWTAVGRGVMAEHVDLIELARHMAWADATVWDSVLRSESGRSDARIRMWLYHIHTVQQAFVQLWRGELPRFTEPIAFADAHALCQWGREGHEACQAFLAHATPETLAREVRVPWAAEIEQTWNRKLSHPTLAQTATQVAMHSAHHRGQVSVRLRELGGEPPVSDFIAWVWWGQPPASWAFLSQPLPDAGDGTLSETR